MFGMRCIFFLTLNLRFCNKNICSMNNIEKCCVNYDILYDLLHEFHTKKWCQCDFSVKKNISIFVICISGHEMFDLKMYIKLLEFEIFALLDIAHTS